MTATTSTTTRSRIAKTISQTTASLVTSYSTSTTTARTTLTVTETAIVTSAAGLPTKSVAMELTRPSNLAGDVIWINQNYFQCSVTAPGDTLVMTPGGRPLLLGLHKSKVLYAGDPLPGVSIFYST